MEVAVSMSAFCNVAGKIDCFCIVYMSACITSRRHHAVRSCNTLMSNCMVDELTSFQRTLTCCIFLGQRCATVCVTLTYIKGVVVCVEKRSTYIVDFVQNPIKLLTIMADS